MIENEKLRIVDIYYSKPEFAPVSTRILYSSDALKYRYSKEFQADYFATAYCGPVFPGQLLTNYFTKEVFILPDHPSWEGRIEVLAEELRNMNLQNYAQQLHEKSQLLSPSPPMFDRRSITDLPTILSKTWDFLLEKRSIYEMSKEKEEKAKRRLENFTPYTDDVKTLLNVAEEVKKSIVDRIQDPSEKEKMERKFNYLIEDCIRLSNLKRTFKTLSG